jgi:predicted site-specific integrase-resolvase
MARADEFVTRADVFMPEELWCVRRVARTLGVSVATVRRYTREGRIEAMRLAPTVVRYNPLDVDRFISRGEQRIRREVEERKARQESELVCV